MAKVNTKCRVLVVDDDLATRKLERVILEREQYQVYEAENGHQALETLQEKPIDLVVTDIDMPHMDGIGLLRSLKASPMTSYLPVILCTSSSEQHYVQQALSLGISAYFVKPIAAKNFILKVAKARQQIVPVLSDPQRTIYNLGIETHEFQDLIRLMVEDARSRLRDLGRSIEAGDIDEFDKFSKDLAATARNFGASALQMIATEANDGMQNAETSGRGVYVLTLRTQIDRLLRAVLEL